MADVVIRFQTLASTWEVAGSDRKLGIRPEHVKYAADQNGSSTASFDLRREPGVLWPDITAFTPVEIEIDGTLVWSGRVKETPNRQTATESVINVQCEGWQYHLDDDPYRKLYVRTKLSDWVDTRTHPAAALGTWTSDLYVSNERGAITIGGQNGTTWRSGKEVGIMIDLGPNTVAKAIDVTCYRTAGNPTAVTAWGRATNNPANFNSAPDISDAFSGVGLNTITTTYAGQFLGGTFATPYRYVAIFLYNSGADYTVAPSDGNGDVLIITGINIYGDTAYRGSNQSLLKASYVISDSLPSTPLLSQSTSKITTTAFNIPDFSLVEPATPREAQDAVNAFHSYVRKVNVDKELVFQPKPATPILAVGAGSTIEVEDASANSIEELYSRVLVTGSDAAGSPLVSSQSASGPAGIPIEVRAISTPVPTNPSADVNTTGWSAITGSISRDTTVFNTSPASIKCTSGGGSNMVGTFTGTFKQGVTYAFEAVYRRDGGTFSTGTSAVTFEFGDLTTGDKVTGGMKAATGPNQWVGINPQSYPYIFWTPNANTSNVSFKVTGGSAVTQLWVDSLVLSQSINTSMDRRGFVRTKILPLSFPATQATADQIGATWLADHTKTPFKGSITAHGDTVEELLTGRKVSVWTLPLYTTELIRLNHRYDPDTAGIGRDGRIAQVDVDVDAITATIALDNTRTNFEAYLERLALVTNARVQ
jgi:hypothetical protein